MSSALMGNYDARCHPEKSCQQSRAAIGLAPCRRAIAAGRFRAKREHAWGEARCVEDRLCAADELRRGCGLE